MQYKSIKMLYACNWVHYFSCSYYNFSWMRTSYWILKVEAGQESLIFSVQKCRVQVKSSTTPDPISHLLFTFRPLFCPFTPEGKDAANLYVQQKQRRHFRQTCAYKKINNNKKNHKFKFRLVNYCMKCAYVLCLVSLSFVPNKHYFYENLFFYCFKKCYGCSDLF